MAEAADFKAALQERRINSAISNLLNDGDVAKATSLVRQVRIHTGSRVESNICKRDVLTRADPTVQEPSLCRHSSAPSHVNSASGSPAAVTTALREGDRVVDEDLHKAIALVLPETVPDHSAEQMLASICPHPKDSWIQSNAHQIHDPSEPEKHSKAVPNASTT
jgi:hypothetical protein